MHSSGRGGGKEGQIPIVDMIYDMFIFEILQIFIMFRIVSPKSWSKIRKNLGKDFYVNFAMK